MVFVNFFVDFVAPGSVCFFDVKFDVLHQFVFALFAFLHVFFAIVCACAFDMFTHKPIATIKRPKLCPLPALFGFLASPKLD